MFGKNNYKKINVILTTNPAIDVVGSDSTGIIFSDEFNERIRVKENEYANILLKELNENIGLDNWTVVIHEYSMREDDKFNIDIYCKIADFHKVADIINRILPDKFILTSKGAIEDYIPK